jgi:Lysyl oxidase
MKLLHARDLRILPFAILGGLAVVAAQSCDESSSKTRAAAHSSGAPGMSVDRGVGVGGASDLTPSGSELVTGAAKPAPPPIPCAKGGDECPSGFVCCPQCCLADLPPVCLPITDGGACPLPDLTVDEGMLATKTYLEEIDGTQCELEEACLGGPGKRKVVRFDVSVPNKGVADLVLGNPDAGGPFVYAKCHNHYHFTGFARYQLVSEEDNKVVLVGRKQAFCARDSARYDQAAPYMPRYDCTMQGISVGWSDVYDPSLPCQFLDVTDVPSGAYRLEIDVNPDRTITESNYDNNHASIRVKLP